MIRDYKKEDVDEIIRIYTLEYKAMPAEVESLRNAAKILVYEDNGIQGFIRLMINGDEGSIEMGVANDELIMPVGLKLWEEGVSFLKEKSVTSVNVYHVKDNLQWQKFFNEIGFEYWYSVYRFTYTGPKFQESDLQIVKYEDKYFHDKISLESEAFSTLRRDHDIKPYNWYLGASKEDMENARKWTLENGEYIYLFFENNEMIGASMVKDAEIDLLFVNVKYQKQSYGKKILEFTVNRGLEQEGTAVNLNALASNEKALKLYKNTGFKVVQAQDIRRFALLSTIVD